MGRRFIPTIMCPSGLLNQDGGQGRNRTTDTRIFSPLLYRLSYLAKTRSISQRWAMDLPNSTPHWSKGLMPQTMAWHTTLCS